VIYAPMTAAEAFLAGEVVQVVAAGTVTAIHKNGAQYVLADAASPHMTGLAINGPGAAATAELTAANGWGRLWNHPDSGDGYAASSYKGGAVGSPLIWMVPFGDPQQYFVTSKILAAGGATAETAASITGADRGDQFQITYCSGTTPDVGWGVERTAGVKGTDFVATVVDVLDATGRSVSIAGVGTQYVFNVTI
jgi:hypothetical protein